MMKIVRFSKIFSNVLHLSDEEKFKKVVFISDKIKKRGTKHQTRKAFERSTQINEKGKIVRNSYIGDLEIVSGDHNKNERNKSRSQTIKFINRRSRNKNKEISELSTISNNNIFNRRMSHRGNRPILEEESNEHLNFSDIYDEDISSQRNLIVEHSPRSVTSVDTPINSKNATTPKNFINAKQTETIDKADKIDATNDHNNCNFVSLKESLLMSILNTIIFLSMIFIIFFSLFSEEFFEDYLDKVKINSSDMCVALIRNSLKPIVSGDSTAYPLFLKTFDFCYNSTEENFNEILYADFSDISVLKSYSFESLHVREFYYEVIESYRENLDYINLEIVIEGDGKIKMTISLVDQFLMANLLWLLQSISICIILAGFVRLFSKDISFYMISPLDNLYQRIKKYTEDKSELFIPFIFDKDNGSFNETYIIENKVNKLLKVMLSKMGNRFLSIIAYGEIIKPISINSNFPGFTYKAVCLTYKLKGDSLLIKKAGVKSILIINQINNLIHSLAKIYLGKIVHSRNSILWVEDYAAYANDENEYLKKIGRLLNSFFQKCTNKHRFYFKR